MKQGHVEDTIRKEFLAAMRAKGKLPRIVTDASERFDKSYYETAPRIFPGPGGITTVLDNMVQQTEMRIDAAQQRHQHVTSSGLATSVSHSMLQPHGASIFSATAGQATAARAAGLCPNYAAQCAAGAAHPHRHQLKAQLARMDHQLQAERTQRQRTEHQLHVEVVQLQDNRLARNNTGGTGGTLQERMQAQGRLQGDYSPHIQPQPLESAIPQPNAAAQEQRSCPGKHRPAGAAERTALLLMRQKELQHAVAAERQSRIQAERLLSTLKGKQEQPDP